MKPALVLPVGAVSFGAGILALGETLPPIAAAGPLVAGAFFLWWAARSGRGGARSGRLLGAAGLLRGPSGPRAEILAAAGVGGRVSRTVSVGTGGAVLVAGFVLLGGGWASLRSASSADAAALDGRVATFRGTAASDVRRVQFGWAVEASVDAVESDGRLLPVSFRVWLGGDGRPPAIEAGQPLVGRGSIRAVEPEGSGFHEYLARRSVTATISPSELSPLGPPANPALRLANATRDSLRRGADRVMAPRDAGLLLGLTIGDTGSMDPEIEEDFRATGLGHLVAVSGSNVVMVLAPVLALGALLRASPTTRFAIGAATVAFFALVTRWEPSVLRASVMAALALFGVLAGRPRTTASLLGAAVLVLLVADPALARSAAFQLSVAATAGIAVLAGPLSDRLSWLPRPLAVATAATVGAQAAVTPVLLFTFGIVPTAGLPANVLAAPAVASAFLGGVVAAGSGLVWEPMGHLLGKVAALPIGYLAWLADRMARLPLPSVVATGWVPALVAACLVALVVWRLRKPRRPGRAGMTPRRVAVAAALLVAWPSVLHPGTPGGLTVTFLDVGQGDSALVRSPGGATILVDAGPDEQLVATRLARMGVGRIDLVAVSHAHADHVEGFPAVLARHPVGLLIEPGCPYGSPTYRDFLDAVADEDVPVRHPRGGARLTVGDLVVEVLGPDACVPDEPNDSSLVLRISGGGGTVLFPGDAEVPAQEDLLADEDPIAAPVLKVPHQGAATSSDDFLTAVGAGIAVVSVGPNEYGHPVPSTLATLRRAGARVLRTDRLGDITVRFGEDGITAEAGLG